MSDGTFSNGQSDFTAASLDGVVSYDGEVDFAISAASEELWDEQLTHAVSITAGQSYTLCFDAKSDEGPRTIAVVLDEGEPTYGELASGNSAISVGEAYTSFSHTFEATASDETARVQFMLGGSDVDVQLDNIGLYEGTECGSPVGGSASSSSAPDASSSSSSEVSSSSEASSSSESSDSSESSSSSDASSSEASSSSESSSSSEASSSSTPGQAGGDAILFEEDFEAYTAGQFPASPWMSMQMDPTRVSIVGDSHSGSQAALVSSPGSFMPSFMSVDLAPSANAADHLYFRMYINASAGLGGDGGHGNFMELGAEQEIIRYGEANGSIGVNTLAGGDPLSPKPDQADNDMPAGSWHCLEVLFDKRPMYDEMTTWIDGEIVHQISIDVAEWGEQWTNNGPAMNWLENAFNHDAKFGWYAFNGVRGNSILFDDLVISKEPVGCDYLPSGTNGDGVIY